jgi:hypothetical protein
LILAPGESPLDGTQTFNTPVTIEAKQRTPVRITRIDEFVDADGN